MHDLVKTFLCVGLLFITPKWIWYSVVVLQDFEL